MHTSFFPFCLSCISVDRVIGLHTKHIYVVVVVVVVVVVALVVALVVVALYLNRIVH